MNKNYDYLLEGWQGDEESIRIEQDDLLRRMEQ